MATVRRVHMLRDTRLSLRQVCWRSRCDAEIERLVELGRIRLRGVEEDGEAWTVLQDPEGREFCIFETFDYSTPHLMIEPRVNSGRQTRPWR